jgi:hypothetical protein
VEQGRQATTQRLKVRRTDDPSAGGFEAGSFAFAMMAKTVGETKFSSIKFGMVSTSAVTSRGNAIEAIGSNIRIRKRFGGG